MEPGSVFDAALRDEIVPNLLRYDGVRCVYVGRRGADESGDRVVASVWESATALADALLLSADERFDYEQSAEVTDGVLETLPIALEYQPDEAVPPSILRIFRGEVRPGEAARYAEETGAMLAADVDAGHGPTALFLGIDEPDRVVTISAWVDWEALETATGGNLTRPIATRRSERLVRGAADHYELVPNAARRASLRSPA